MMKPRRKNQHQVCALAFLPAILLTLTSLSAQENRPASSRPSPTHAQLSSQDVLSITNGKFFLEGKPFAEISFNKYDLFWQLYEQASQGKPLNATNPLVQAQDRALRNLHDLGFKTIRIFALPWGPAGPASYADPTKRKNLYAALDKTVELCDAHEIRLVWSLSAGSFTDTQLNEKGWVYGQEQQRELIANPNSRSRKLLYQYLDETVARYRPRRAVVLWEISNEVTLSADIGDSNRVYNGERMPTLKDVAGFFDDIARRIKSADPLRLVCSGGSNMRESQWHLYQGEGWKPDTFEQQFSCFQLLYATSAVEVIDIHSYPDNQPGYAITDDAGQKMWLDDKGYMAIARRLDKPLMIGELGLRAVARTDKKLWEQTPDYFDSYDNSTAAKPWVKKTLDDVIAAGVSLSYWWCYQSDDPAEQNNHQRFDIDRERNPELVACVADANRRLKAALHAAP
jgi:hypothetical protein